MENKITHEEAKKNLFDNNEIDLNLHYNYIKQQEAQSKRLEKVEELLELKNELIKLYHLKKYKDTNENFKLHDTKIYNKLVQIKQKEKELEEIE